MTCFLMITLIYFHCEHLGKHRRRKEESVIILSYTWSCRPLGSLLLHSVAHWLDDLTQTRGFKCCLYAHDSHINISSPILSTRLQTRCQETEPCGYLIASETQFGHNKSLAFHPLRAKLFSPLIFPFLLNVTTTPSRLSQKLEVIP